MGPPPRALLIDIDGVLAVSWRAVPGAPGAMARLREAGVPLRLVTNTTSRPRSAMAGALVEAGFAIEEGEILSAPVATAAYLRKAHPGARCGLLSSGSAGEDLDGIDLVPVGADGSMAGGVDVLVIGGAGPEFTYEAFNRVFALAAGGTPVVAMHRNVSWRTTHGVQLDSGAYLAGLARAAGVEVTVVGKPDPAMFAAALDDLGVAASDAGMVGDDLEADVLGAQSAGLTGILVRTGKFHESQLERAPAAPDVVLDSIVAVPAWLGL